MLKRSETGRCLAAENLASPLDESSDRFSAQFNLGFWINVLMVSSCWSLADFIWLMWLFTISSVLALRHGGRQLSREKWCDRFDNFLFLH
jgi:hypothetical protein